MATPTILIEQDGQASGTAGQSRTDLVTGSLVTLSDPANGGVGTHTWALVAPYGSASALSSTSATSPTFTPDIEGTYLVYLQVDVDYSYQIDANGQRTSTQGGAAVLLTNGTRALGKGETGQFGNWSDSFHPNFAVIDAMIPLSASSTVTVLTDGANVSIDASASGVHSITATSGVGATRQLDNPTGFSAGMSWIVWFIQDATGGRELTFGSYYDWGDEGAPTFAAQGANKKNILTFVALSSTQIAATALKGFA